MLASCLVIAVPSGSDAETIGDGDVPTYTITIKDAEGLTKYVTTESGETTRFVEDTIDLPGGTYTFGLDAVGYEYIPVTVSVDADISVDLTTMLLEATITQHPVGATDVRDSTYTLSVSAEHVLGDEVKIQYQWYVSNGDTHLPIDGAKGSTYTIDHGGTYAVAVSVHDRYMNSTTILSHSAEVSFHGQGAIDDDGTAQTDEGKVSTEITIIAVAIFAIALVLACLAAVRSR